MRPHVIIGIFYVMIGMNTGCVHEQEARPMAIDIESATSDMTVINTREGGPYIKVRSYEKFQQCLARNNFAHLSYEQRRVIQRDCLCMDPDSCTGYYRSNVNSSPLTASQTGFTGYAEPPDAGLAELDGSDYKLWRQFAEPAHVRVIALDAERTRRNEEDIRGLTRQVVKDHGRILDLESRRSNGPPATDPPAVKKQTASPTPAGAEEAQSPSEPAIQTPATE